MKYSKQNRVRFQIIETNLLGSTWNGNHRNDWTFIGSIFSFAVIKPGMVNSNNNVSFFI